MAKVLHTSITTELAVKLELNEDEVRALNAIFGYSVDQFLAVFYERMGKAYVQPHEAGVRSLHATLRQQLTGPLKRLDTAKLALHEALKIPS